MGGPLAEAYAALGMEELYSDWDVASGGRDLRRALEINPNFAEARRHYSWYLSLLGRHEEGLAEMKRAEELEPLVPLFPADLAWQHLNSGHLDAAMAEARKSLELNPNFAQALALLGWVYAEKGMYREALAAHQKAALADPAWRWPLGRAYALAGSNDQARSIALEMQKEPGPMEQWGLAVIYAALGEKDQAFRWLEAAYHSRFSWMPYNSDFVRPNLFAPLRDDPRFGDITRRVFVRSGGAPPGLHR
ncbi:MAG: tetratricopeptide repeat protein [Acidobacteriia bacterium]|nr:tetratricopeptide repeat protein [Terriglobia bacterium]